MDARLSQASDLEKKEAVDKEPIWRVLLHNDDVHTFDYVIDTIVKVVRTVTRKKAHRITMEAHKSGLATVTTTWKQLAREYSVKLRTRPLSRLAPRSMPAVRDLASHVIHPRAKLRPGLTLLRVHCHAESDRTHMSRCVAILTLLFSRGLQRKLASRRRLRPRTRVPSKQPGDLGTFLAGTSTSQSGLLICPECLVCRPSRGGACIVSEGWFSRGGLVTWICQDQETQRGASGEEGRITASLKFSGKCKGPKSASHAQHVA